MATYVNDLRLKEIATGDESGTWGTSTNTNLELIGEAFSFGTEAITTNADTHTTTIADGTTDPGRSIYLKYTGTLDSACTITIGPNTVSKLWFIENGTSGSQNIILSQGSGANITIPAGDTKVVYSDGAGSGAAFFDAFASLNVGDLTATNITGTLATAAQPNITSVGTLTGFTSTGIDDNADATAITIDSSENVGIGTASPDAKLAIDATSQGNFTEAMRISNTGGGANEGNYIQFEISNTSGYGPRIGGRREGSGGSGLHFYTGENNAVPTEKVRIDHDGNVGIGTASPSEKLTIQSGNINFMGGTNDAQYIKFGDTGDDDIGNILYYHGNNNMVFTTNASEAMRIDASSNLGIGTTSPSSYNSAMNDLVVAGSGDSGITIASGTSSEGSIGFADGTSGADAYRGWINYNHANNFMRFFTNASEAMRIDSLGNFLVGTTTTNIATEGAVIYGSGNEGVMQLSSTNMTALYVNRSTDGELVQFRKAAAVVGSIGTDATDIYIGTTDTGIRFNDAVNGVLPYNTSSGQTDNTIDLGFSSVRWKDIYAANGTIQTSDINEKQDIEDLTEAETRVAVSAKGLLKKYRWKSAVEEKGNDARIHFGIMAQDLQDAFAAEGLDAGDYGMFISTTWTDETTGEEKTRLGVRYNELLAFIIAAI